MVFDSETVIRHLLQRIHEAEVARVPFPHIFIGNVLPDTFYEELLDRLPSTDEMQTVDYPGTGHGPRGRHFREYGFAFADFRRSPGALGMLALSMQDERFGDALLAKFAPDIPPEKQTQLAMSRDYAVVFDLQYDLAGYAIAPHADIPSKIVTFQLYLSSDDSMRDEGTKLCEPIDGRAVGGRSKVVRRVARTIDRLPHQNALYRRLERSSLGLTLGVGANAAWLPWSWFRVVREVPALPNSFLAFAPRSDSFHAVSMSDFEGIRPVVRGFIRAGRDSANWIGPHRAPARVPTRRSLRRVVARTRPNGPGSGP